MKIRKGFVSNSSSSSFIIDGNKYTCVDIAFQIIDVLVSEDNNYKEKYKKIKNNLKKLKNKDTSILIEYCDNIYIVKKDDKIYVEASYHYEWNLIKCEEEGEYYDIIYEEKFYFPLYDNKYLGKLANTDNSCNKCHCGFLEFDDGSVFCPSCLCDPDGNPNQKLFRKEKLKRILKDEN
ncbi:MAG: hypothetical protein HPY57_15100 [Ignavibacteria bacterium]|nr:hypothetical protein [Ignavibacteria bacterium]